MGCAASVPDSVIDVGNGNQNSQDLQQVLSFPIEVAEQNLNNQNTSDALQEPAQPDRLSSFHDLDIPKEPIIIKANASDLLYTCTDNDSKEVSNTDVKKGYVTFDVNLDGVVDPTLECKTKPLPKRLKHLAPLDGAPKLTAEELNDKLERAEQKRLKALSKRKNGTSRRSEKSATTSTVSSNACPDQTGDAPNNALPPTRLHFPSSQGEEATTECNQEESANESLSEETDAFSFEVTNEKEITHVPETQCVVDDKDDLSATTQVFEVVDLYDSNNNAQDFIERAMSQQLVVGQSFQILSRSRQLLHSVEEVEEERSD